MFYRAFYMVYRQGYFVFCPFFSPKEMHSTNHQQPISHYPRPVPAAALDSLALRLVFRHAFYRGGEDGRGRQHASRGVLDQVLPYPHVLEGALMFGASFGRITVVLLLHGLSWYVFGLSYVPYGGYAIYGFCDFCVFCCVWFLRFRGVVIVCDLVIVFFGMFCDFCSIS